MIFSSVATPTITASTDSYETDGSTAVTLTCTSTSDVDGKGTYKWKLGGKIV